MIGKLKLKSILAICLGVVLCQATMFAAVSIDATVSKTTLSVNEVLDYKVTISGTKAKINIDEKFLSKDFFVLRQSSSQSYQLINGQFSASQIKTFVLRPKDAGEFVIPSLKVTIDGKTVTTQSIKINVRGLGGTTATNINQQNTNANNQRVAIPPGNSRDLFMLASLSKQEAYVGEEVILKVDLYRRVQGIDKFYYEEPEIKALTEPLERNKKIFTKTFNGRQYYVQEVDRKAIFCYEPGDLAIDPIRAEIQVNIFFGSQIAQSNPLQLVILPLPLEDKPENFSGLVGEFMLETNVDTGVIIENKPVAVQLSLIGKGNLKQLTEFNSNADDTFKVYQSAVTDQITYTDSVKGIRKFEYIVVPKQPGDSVLPTFSTTYFSPKTKTYQTLESAKQDINIIASGEIVETTTKPSNEITQLVKDLKYITEDIELENQWKPFTKQPLAWLLILINTILLGFILSTYAYSVPTVQQWVQSFALKPKAVAIKQLALIQKENDPKAISQIQQIVTTYIATVIKQPAKGLTLEEITEQLNKQKVSKEVIEQLKLFLEQCTYMAYSPDLDKVQQSSKLCDDAINIIKKVA